MKPRRNGNGSNGSGNGAGPVVCAIYTRKSTDEGLERDFNSLDAQREACLAYIASQKHAGWLPCPEIFEDGGFSGGTLERPALRRVRAAIEAGEVQCVVVYRADRLSRRILDFLQLVELFDQHGVAFVSVTEQFNTSTPGGRLHQHMLLSYAQYERELIAERTRHKMQAARRKGKFTGGQLILGYDRAPEGGRLVVNQAEAERVRAIFRLFVETGSIIATVEELNRRGWTLKKWTTKEGRERGGGAFDKYTLKRLLTNHAYVGEVRFDGAVYPAEHEAIVDRRTWDALQALMVEAKPQIRSTPSPALLAGILRCAPCDAAMTPTYSQKGRVRYRYYLCRKAHRRGWKSCPSKSVPATEIERFVVDQIRAIGSDPEMVAATTEQARAQLAARRSELDAGIREARKALDAAHAAARAQITAAGNGRARRRGNDGGGANVAALEERLAALRDERATLPRIDPADLQAALGAFDPVWEHLTTAERQRVVHLLIERIDYDGAASKVAITFSPEGVRILASERPAAAEAAR